MLREHSRATTLPAATTVAAAADLLRRSFPPEELFEIDQLGETVASGERTLWTDDHAVLVTAGLGTTVDDTLLEYLAVDPSARSSGVGSRVVHELVDRLPGPVVFEMDLPDPSAEATMRRLRFYERLGAARIPFSEAYAMPDQVSGGTLPMWLMDLTPSRRTAAWSRSSVAELVTAVWVHGYGALRSDLRLGRILAAMS